MRYRVVILNTLLPKGAHELSQKPLDRHEDSCTLNTWQRSPAIKTFMALHLTVYTVHVNGWYLL